MLRLIAALFLGLFAGVTTARAETISELRILNDSFLSPAFDSEAKSSYQFLGADFSTGAEPVEGLNLDLRAAYAFGEPLLSYLNLSQFYYSTKVGKNQEFSFGRRRQVWSELDARWDFGLVEPVFRWNALSPERQGLTGLFWQVEDAGYRLSLFGSFIYLPDQGPSFELDSNGEFVRGNPWFRRPPEGLRVLSEVSKIEYKFQKPSESQIVLQPSYGARLELGTESLYKARFSHLFKPANQLALGYDGVLDIPKDRGVVEIQPAVVLHTVTSADLYYEDSAVTMGVSAAIDHPSDQNVFDDKWTKPVFSDAQLISPFLDWRITREWTASVQGIQVLGGDVTETGDLASADRPSITSRYPFQEAGQLSLEWNRRLKKSRSLHLKGSYMASSKNEFQLVRTEGRLDLSRFWSVQAEMQLVAAEDLTKENRNDIAQFANNDRLLVGVGYAF